MRKSKTLDIVYIALGAALMAICAWISIPAAVPFTLQTFAVFAVLGLLGGKRGTASIIVYVLLGAVGLPVFAGFKGGFGALLGNTGGYIIGFIFSGLCYMLVIKFLGKKTGAMFLAMLLGLIVCYAFGTAWFMLLYMKANGPVTLLTTLTWCVIPFILPDVVKIMIALFLTKRVGKFIES